MKSRFKKLLPVMVMAVAVAGAFSTHAMDKRAERADLVNGYIKLNSMGTSCQAESSTVCTTENTGEQCKVGYSSSGDDLFLIEAGRCIQPLYRPANN
ncbi:MAG: hypothetical protein JXB49_15505 [Bacteroidales bacterium]|nr:hypothetical protein [Bacteroidales bacterium]